MRTADKLTVLLMSAERFAKAAQTRASLKVLAKCIAMRDRLTGQEREFYGHLILRCTQISIDYMA